MPAQPRTPAVATQVWPIRQQPPPVAQSVALVVPLHPRVGTRVGVDETVERHELPEAQTSLLLQQPPPMDEGHKYCDIGHFLLTHASKEVVKVETRTTPVAPDCVVVGVTVVLIVVGIVMLVRYKVPEHCGSQVVPNPQHPTFQSGL